MRPFPFRGLLPVLVALCVSVLCIPFSAHAKPATEMQDVDSGKTQLETFFADLDSLSAAFEQTVQDPQGNITQRLSGTVELARPMKFHWRYTAPYVQDIVADGQRLWLYDHDLEQVTVKSLDKNLRGTPASLLGSKRPLEESFDIREAGNHGGLAWVELRPRQEDTGFDSIRMGFAGGTLVVMELLDSFGQTSIISFTELKKNTTIAPKQFVFEPPPGVDIIYDDPPLAR
ncbi:MAG TPA: outer membrane lipoprotein chaperone LolA [Gammaproteobacteria bacterium]|nr:outer membrane lipoprotein chaperone LolA [Gammaproteobacteria bacterium]